MVSEHAGSGQSVAAFCRERGVSVPQFFAWKKRLSQAECSQVRGSETGAAITARFLYGRIF